MMIRTLVLCRSSSLLRLSPSVHRSIGSLENRHKEHSLKREDFFIDPNLKKAFNKIKQGDFIPPVIEMNSIKDRKMSTKADEKYQSNLSTKEKLREDFLGKLVYVGKLEKPFRAAKSLSLASSLGGAICYPIMLPKILEEASMIFAIGYTIISATFVLLTPSLIQMISKRYLTSIYYHEKTGQFTAFYKNFFMMERQIRFRSEDVQVPPITGMFTSMLVNDQPYFVNHEDFEDKQVLMKMLGYDKEFDFTKYTKDIQNRKSLNDDDDDDDDGNQKKNN